MSATESVVDDERPKSELTRVLEENQRLAAEVAERAGELEVITSIQHAVAAEVDFQGIAELVGERLRELFEVGSLGIAWFDRETSLVHDLYVYEDGARLERPPEAVRPGGIVEQVLRTKSKVVFQTFAEARARGAILVVGTKPNESNVWVPMIDATGVVGFIDLERPAQNAFSESEIRLIETVASSVGVALASARLFEENRTLLTGTEQRASELEVITSIQQAVAAEIDFQAIADLVGGRLRSILGVDTLAIIWFERSTGCLHDLYFYEAGARYEQPPSPPTPGGLFEQLMSTRSTLSFSTSEESLASGATVIEGTSLNESIVRVPMVDAKGVVGFISIERPEAHAFSDSDVRLLETVTATVGVALANARLFDQNRTLLIQTEQRAGELEVINSIQRGIAAELDYGSIAELVGARLSEILGVDTLSITRFDHDTRLVHYLYLRDTGVKTMIPPVPPTESFERMLVSGETVVFDTDAEAVAHGAPNIPGTNVLESLVRVPIVDSQGVSGAITIERLEQYAFSESDVRLLETVASTVGVALANARLFDQNRTLLNETEQRAGELEVVNSIQRGIAAELDFEAIAELVGHRLTDLLDVDALSIARLDRATGLVHTLFGCENGVDFRQAPHPPSVGGLFEELSATRKPIVYHTDSQALANGATNVAGTTTHESMISVPILDAEGVIGSITAERLDPHAFGDADLRLVETVATSVGVALENARLFDQI